MKRKINRSAIRQHRARVKSVARLAAICSLVSIGGCTFTITELREPSSRVKGVDAGCDAPSKQVAAKQEEPKARLAMPQPKVAKLPEPSLDVTPEVKRHLRAFGGTRSRFIEQAVDQRDQSYPQLAQIFKDEGVPETMLNLAMIESGFRNEARSPVGAVGMWQFMKSTARLYGLKIGLIDERKDPILSTIAAARHLRDLYNQYGDWHLALAAYNAGTGAIDRILSRSSSRNFWALARSGQFSRQTAEFVPKFIAASLLINNVVAERTGSGAPEQFASLSVIQR